MALLIPAGDAAGGPVRASLSLCIFPVIKQMVAQDSVHAEYGGGRKIGKHSTSVFSSLLTWPPRYMIYEADNTDMAVGTNHSTTIPHTKK